MEVTTGNENGTLIARVGGRIDGANAAEFENAMRQAIVGTEVAVVLDCEALSYISSAALRAILRIAKDLNRQAVEFALRSLSDPIREVFRISGFDKIIYIHPNRSGTVSA